MSTISLCMIVKNEEEMLPACLESVADWVDEMIVVDTGSTDKTKEIASSMGAKVFDFEWINDFAAARNHAKAQATGDYLLILDADERLAPGDGEVLREEVNNLANQTVVFLTLMNSRSRFSSLKATVEGSERVGSPVLLPRLVVNSPTMKWVGKIHESPTIDTATLGRINVNIVHVGADVEWRESRQKGERNLQMLTETLNSSDQERTALFWSYMAAELFNAGQQKEFFDALKKSWDQLSASINNGILVNSGVAPLYPSVLVLRGKIQEGLEALHFLIKNWQYASTNPANLLYHSANVLTMIDYPASAKESILNMISDIAEMLLELDGEAFIDETLWGVTNIKAYMLLGFAQMKLGNYEKSFEAIDKGLELQEGNESLKLLKIECLLEEGNIPQCLAMILEELNTSSEKQVGPDIWVLASTACLAMGNEEDSSMFLDQALLRKRLTFSGMHRLRLLQGIATRRDVLAGKPRAGKGAYGVLGSILSREPVMAFNDVPLDVIKKVVYNLLQRGKTDLVERFFDARAQHILPGIKAKVIGILEEIGVEVIDDGSLDPIFLLGDGLEALTAMFEEGEDFAVVHLGAEHSQFIQDKWLEHETEKSEAFLFGDLSFLDDDDDDDDDEDTDTMLEMRSELQKSLLEHRKNNERLVVLMDGIEGCFEQLAEILPKSYFLFHLEDPRTTAMKEVVESTTKAEELTVRWGERLEVFESIHLIGEDRYVGLNNTLIQEAPKVVLSRLFACIGENWNEDLADVWSGLESSQVDWVSNLNDEVLETIESKLGETMRSWNIPVTADDEAEVEA